MNEAKNTPVGLAPYLYIVGAAKERVLARGTGKILMVLFGMFFSALRAQEKLGITNSNYSPGNSVFLNAASTVDSKTFINVNLVGANLFAKTNLAHIPGFSLWSWRQSGEVPRPQIRETKANKYFYGLATADGPSFFISKRNYGAGLFVRARTVMNVRRLPHQLTSLLLMQDPVGPNELDIHIKNAGFSNMSWIEYGANFGAMIKKKRNDLLSFGGNLRYLSGINVIYGNIGELTGYYNDTVINVERLAGKLRFNTPAFNSGRGWGLDLGITYQKMLENVDSYYAHSQRSNCKVIDYKYKFGLSLRDVGYIKFRQNTSKADFDASGYFFTDRHGRSFKPMLEDNLNTGFKSDPITAALPASLSGQLDYNFENNIYLNFTVVKNLVPNTVTGVQSPNLISVCPRFETRNFEFALPLTFQRFIYPQLGFAFRVRSLVVGMDNLFPLIVKKNTYGLNVYFTLGFSWYRNPACKARCSRVDDCPPHKRGKLGGKRKGLLKRVFTWNNTYSK